MARVLPSHVSHHLGKNMMNEARSLDRLMSQGDWSAMGHCVAAAALLWLGASSQVLAQEPQAQPTTLASSMVFYVSPDGNDSFSGGLADTNSAKTDGPLASMGGARDRVRELKTSGRLDGPLTVYLRGGRYPL